MKRFMTRLLTALLAVSIVASMAVGASAIELKTGIGIVESNGLRLRAKPNTDAEILANASYGDNVVIIREVDGWYLVDYNLQIGYMSAEYITFKERENIDLGYGVVEDASVNLRSTPAPTAISWPPSPPVRRPTSSASTAAGTKCSMKVRPVISARICWRSPSPRRGTPRPMWARALLWSLWSPWASRL